MGEYTPLLAGNSVYVDYLFLKVIFCALIDIFYKLLILVIPK